MRQIELVTLNMRELDRLKVVQAIVEMGLKPGRAAERLGLSVRQIERLVQRDREGSHRSRAAGVRHTRAYEAPTRVATMTSSINTRQPSPKRGGDEA
jgi:transposase